MYSKLQETNGIATKGHVTWRTGHMYDVTGQHDTGRHSIRTHSRGDSVAWYCGTQGQVRRRTAAPKAGQEKIIERRCLENETTMCSTAATPPASGPAVHHHETA
jgi:hypothetical protein